MKKINNSFVCLGFFLLIASSSAEASIARLSAFGTQPVFTSSLGALPSAVTTNTVNGSLWLDDDYNIFYNPSFINDYKNMITFQKGYEGGALIPVTERTVFGLFANRGGTLDRNYFNQTGVYTSGAQRMYAPGLIAPGIREIAGFGSSNNFTGGGQGTSVETHVPIDVFFGGDYGVKWGLHLVTAQNPYYKVKESGSSEKARYWHADAGIQFLGFEPFVGATFSSKISSELANEKNAGTQSLSEFDVGTRFKYESTIGYLVYKSFEESGVPLNATKGLSTSLGIFGLGASHTSEIIPGLQWIKHAGFFMANVEETDTRFSEAVLPSIYRDYNQFTLPINTGLEYKSSDWLMLRTGLTYSLFNFTDMDEDKPDYTTAQSNLKKMPEFRIGATFKYVEQFNSFSADIVAGNGTAVRNGMDVNQNAGFESQLFAMLSATFKWDQLDLR